MLPMISGNVIIQNRQFTQVDNPSNTSSLSLERLANAIAPNAFHNSKERFDAPKCYPNTRVAVLDYIMNWAFGRSGETSNRTFMWLHGPAGCGKSTIAQTTIKRCLEKGVKLAAFFFNRFDPTRNHSKHLIGTLAYQVYIAFPDTDVQRLMLSAIADDPLIFERTIRHQFLALIAYPLHVYLSSLHSERPSPPGLLIVIDGLDECVDRTSQQDILEALSDSEYAKTIPRIQILIASRPELEIRSSFNSMNMKDTHTRLALDDKYQARADIKLYLRDSFEKIKSNHPFRRYLSSPWPDDELLDTLLDKSSGQFTYAASVVKYVGSIRHRPDHRLEAALHLRPHNGDLPFAQLDSLYTMILQSALDVEKVCRVLSFRLITKSLRIPCSTIERILSYEEGEIDILFRDLQAVVEIQDCGPDYRHLHVLHASFEDYLLDPERSKQFHVDIEQERKRHLASILQYLSSYQPLTEDDGQAIIFIAAQVLRTVICATEPMTTSTLSTILAIPQEDVARALSRLQSVLHVQEGPSGLVSVLHPSFPEFLLNKARSRELYCDIVEHNTKLQLTRHKNEDTIEAATAHVDLEHSHLPPAYDTGLPSDDTETQRPPEDVAPDPLTPAISGPGQETDMHDGQIAEEETAQDGNAGDLPPPPAVLIMQDNSDPVAQVIDQSLHRVHEEVPPESLTPVSEPPSQETDIQDAPIAEELPQIRIEPKTSIREVVAPCLVDEIHFVLPARKIGPRYVQQGSTNVLTSPSRKAMEGQPPINETLPEGIQGSSEPSPMKLVILDNISWGHHSPEPYMTPSGSPTSAGKENMKHFAVTTPASGSSSGQRGVEGSTVGSTPAQKSMEEQSLISKIPPDGSRYSSKPCDMELILIDHISWGRPSQAVEPYLTSPNSPAEENPTEESRCGCYIDCHCGCIQVHYRGCCIIC